MLHVLPGGSLVSVAALCARAVHTEQNTAHVLKGVVFRAQMLLIPYIFKQTRLKKRMQMIQFSDHLQWPDLVIDKSERPSAIGQSLSSSPGTPLENNRTT